MEKLKVDSEAAYAWIEQLVPNTWIKVDKGKYPEFVPEVVQSDDSDKDIDFYDSDYNVQEGGDDLFAEYVDTSLNDSMRRNSMMKEKMMLPLMIKTLILKMKRGIT
jgi:hypothetical protein